MAAALAPTVQRGPPTPAPAAGVSAPSPAPPGVGPAASESDPVLLPARGVSLRLPLSSGRRFPITKEDLSDFNLGVGQHQTEKIPLGESGVQAQVTIGSDSPMTLSEANLVLSPVVGQLDAGQVEQARGADDMGGMVGAAVGGAVGSTVFSPLGGAIGASIGKEIGTAATGDHFIRLILEEGSIAGSFRLTYNPFLKLALSVVGFSWLVDATAHLQTNLNLMVAPKIDLKGSAVSLIFRGGRLAHTEFILKPVLEPKLDLTFDANGQLRAAVNLLPILGNDRKEEGSSEDGGVELAEVVTAPFKLLTYRTTIGGAGVDVDAAKGSPFQVNKANARGSGKIPPAFEEFILKSDKAMPFVAPPDIDGPPRTGRTREKPIPFVWFKPFTRYARSINLPAAHFGQRHSARPFPHKKYKDGQLGTNLELGVDNWPYKGMVLRKRGNERGAEVKEFIRQCEEHGITLPRGYQIDHVIDLVFDDGTDAFHNLWPLQAEVNTRAGGRWSNGTSLVQWRNREIDPPVRSAPSVVPANRYFVISDILDP